MTVGGLPMAVVAWAVSFWLVRRAVARYQRMRRARIRRKVERRQRKLEAALKRESEAAEGSEQ
jgi:hypothetical protein